MRDADCAAVFFIVAVFPNSRKFIEVFYLSKSNADNILRSFSGFSGFWGFCSGHRFHCRARNEGGIEGRVWMDGMQAALAHPFNFAHMYAHIIRGK